MLQALLSAQIRPVWLIDLGVVVVTTTVATMTIVTVVTMVMVTVNTLIMLIPV